MPLRNKPARRPWPGVVLAATLLLCTGTGADPVKEDDIKAGFIINFAKYTEWPNADLGSREILICSLGTQPLSGRLEPLHGRQAQGRQIRVLIPARPSEWRDCQVLFIDANDKQRIPAVLDQLSQQPVLTVSDAEGFAQAGGIIGMKLRAGRVRFEINQGAAHRAGLNLSSQMLKLADEVLQ